MDLSLIAGLLELGAADGFGAGPHCKRGGPELMGLVISATPPEDVPAAKNV